MKFNSNWLGLVYVTIYFLIENIVYAAKLTQDRKEKEWKQERLTFAPEEKIVGGEETTYGRYRYQVGLINDGDFICGGSLINSEWVLSAAHCASCNVNKIKVDVGRHDRNNDTETYEMIDVDFFVIHPDYDEYSSMNDVVLIKLATPSKYPPVKLNDDSKVPEDNVNVTVMGWGRTYQGGPLSNVLLEVEVDVVSNDQCSIAYPDLISDDMLCASRKGKDSCQGDSGGPLILKGDNADSDIQVGIVSWGIGCANPAYPGVYARVSEAYDFIQATISCNIRNGNDFSTCTKAICENGVFTCIENGCFPDDGFNYTNCDIDYFSAIGDGYCDNDWMYNVPECNYDGGDCCVDTCTDGLIYMCGIFSGYNCQNPESNNTGIIDVTFPDDGFDYINSCFLSNSNLVSLVGDGYCDDNVLFNVPQCNYDGGDCCEDTCTDGPIAKCGVDSPYKCLDPESIFTEIVDSFDYSECNFYDGNVGDGYCDPFFNVPKCNYDGGDCCSDTCTDSFLFQCNSSDNFFQCRDPNSDFTCTFPFFKRIWEKLF